MEAWVGKLTSAGVPCGPLYDIPQVFEDAHIKARGVRVERPHPRGESVSILANPARLSATPPSYDRVAPMLGEHTHEVLREVLGLTTEALQELSADGVI